ncbi:MAG: DNA mismatch endonuclease Vsr [Deltaproteobacteria bacterium]|nr:DNA mismatch endonuclease Vsr [Deltaproteobacteria bacterium]
MAEHRPVDVTVSAARSRNMAAIRCKDTSPELRVRRLLHHLGYRFRLHRRDLPGSPDIVLPKHRTVVFVHGCFWHRHPGCRYTSTPKTRADFWANKFEQNIQRDHCQQQQLREMGWSVMVIWECELRDLQSLKARLVQIRETASDFSGSGAKQSSLAA